MCWSYTGFLDRLACSFLARLSVCSLLFGSGGQSSRNGRGATQSPSAFLCILFSITWMNCLSSMERPTLLWSLFLVNTDEPLLSHFSETWILFSHGLNTVGRPLSRIKRLYALIFEFGELFLGRSHPQWSIRILAFGRMAHFLIQLSGQEHDERQASHVQSARVCVPLKAEEWIPGCPLDECNDAQFPVSLYLFSHLECYCIQCWQIHFGASVERFNNTVFSQTSWEYKGAGCERIFHHFWVHIKKIKKVSSS